MIYTCESCRFLFSRAGIPESCPDCGKLSVREANLLEREEYQRNQAEEYGCVSAGSEG